MAEYWPALDLHLPSDDSNSTRLADLTVALLDDLQPSAIDEQARVWRVYFASAAARDAACQALANRLGAEGLTVNTVEVPDEGWGVRTQANLRAVRVGSLVVAPPWDLPDSVPIGDCPLPTTVVIRPSIGFGTGHHASTQLCLGALQRLDLSNCVVLDLGTGSGILAIAAGLLGAASIIAIDQDPQAVQAARRNVALNPTCGAVQIEESDILALGDIRADVVLANLTGRFFVAHAAAVLHHLASRGHLLVSGITQNELPQVRAAFEDALVLVREDGEEEWVGLTWRTRRDAPERPPLQLPPK